MPLEQQRRSAGHVRRCHRRAGHLLNAASGPGGVNVEPGRGQVRLELVRLVLRPTGTARRKLIAQFRPADHDVAAEFDEQTIVEVSLQFSPVLTGDHHRRDIHRAAGRAHRDRWPTLVVDDEHRPRTGLLRPSDLVEKEADTSVNQGDVAVERGGVFDILAGARRIGEHHPACDLA